MFVIQIWFQNNDANVMPCDSTISSNFFDEGNKKGISLFVALIELMLWVYFKWLSFLIFLK